jgi:RHS repeat-associated protein
MTNITGFIPTYDANGGVTNDSLHTYTWNSDGRPVTIDSVNLTYDAFDRMLEQNRSGFYSPIVYAPTGEKIEIMNGQSYTKAFVSLPGGAVAEYGGAVFLYRHSDHLGSSRFVSTYNRTMYYDGAYAPFGEPYAQSGTSDLSFTGQNQDTVSGLYDFPAREYSIQGRWPSPDPDGLDCIYTSDQASSSVKVTVESGTCSKDNGTYVNGTVDVKSLTYNGSELGYSFSNAEEQTGGGGTIFLGQPPNSGDQLSPFAQGVLSQPALKNAAGMVNDLGMLEYRAAGFIFPLSTLLIDAAVGTGQGASAAQAGLRRKPGSLGVEKGTDALRKENKVARDIMKELNLGKEYKQLVHDALAEGAQDAGRKLTFKEGLEAVKAALRWLR